VGWKLWRPIGWRKRWRLCARLALTSPWGVSTGAWIEPDPKRRLAQVRTWRTLPDFAGVNFSEAGADELCAALLEMGIGVESGLWTPGDVQTLAASGHASRCLRILIEPLRTQDFAKAVATVEAIEQVLDSYRLDAPRLLHGKDATVWPLIDLAAERGYDTRVGMEDTLLLANGQTARDNALLVQMARG
jgi:uncharacterized protein (DUF849 family)